MEKTENRKKLEIKKLRPAFIFFVIIVLLIAIIGVMGYSLLKASRMNLYSKNVLLGNNYFLINYAKNNDNKINTEMDQFEGINEAFSLVYSFESNYSPEEYIPNWEEMDFNTKLDVLFSYMPPSQSVNSFISQIEDLHNSDMFDESFFDEILSLALYDGVQFAAQYANDMMGEELFTSDVYAYKIDVPYISQVGILPNGCESVSAVMLLRYSGYDIDPLDFVDNYLEKDEVYIKWGVRYGPNPKDKYAGDPKSEKGGWGCFAPVIHKALNKYLGGKAFAKNLTGLSLEELAEQYITKNIPVAIWCTQNMEEIKNLYQWQSYDKSETFLYPVHEHCVVLTGFDDKYYYFNDPLDENRQVRYEKDIVSASYESMGRQAVAIADLKSLG